jgi:hypothetical protein
LGNYGAATGDAVVLTAQFDPVLRLRCSPSGNRWLWQLPDFLPGSLKVSLTLQIPAGTALDNYLVNWQVQAVGRIRR